MCHEWKPIEDFAFRSRKTGTRQSQCRKCQAAYRRRHYLANRETYIAREVARINGYRIGNRSRLLEYLSTHPCVDCGEQDPVVLDFDHRDPGTKRAAVTYLAARKSWGIVCSEIAKCDVRCANCHRIRTAEQFNWSLGKVKPQLRDAGAPRARSETTQSVDPSTERRECTNCHQLKPLTEFSIKNKKNGRRATRCKSCVAAFSRAHYYANREGYLVRSRATKAKFRKANRRRKAELIRDLACIDCGETNPVVLEFDHRDTFTKTIAVSALMSSGSVTRMLEEIAKCEVRCASCHRRKTARQFSYYRFTAAIRESAVRYAA